MEKEEIPRKMRLSGNAPIVYGRRRHRDHFPAAWLYFAKRARGVSLTRCTRSLPLPSSLSALGTLPKRRVNLVLLIHARDFQESWQYREVRERKREKTCERWKFLPCYTSRSISVSYLDYAVSSRACLFLYVLFVVLGVTRGAPLSLASLRLISRLRPLRYIRANHPAKRWRHAELPSNWLAVSLESHVCQLSRWAKCTNANGAFYGSIGAGNVLRMYCDSGLCF